MQRNRSLPAITRSNGGISSDLSSDFAKELAKQSVQPKSQVDSLYEQMYSIINGTKPRYPSMEAAVQDMLDRTGISTYKRQLQAEQQNTKRANIQVSLFEKVPQIKQTIDNYIQSTRGNLLVPEILSQIKSIHKNDVPDAADWGSPSLLTYINDKNISEKKMHPDMVGLDHDLGRVNYHEEEIDPSNTDALHVLNPAVVK
jgi:hypothetical protein